MTHAKDATAPGRLGAGKGLGRTMLRIFRTRPTLTAAACALLPILLISLAGWLDAAHLRAVLGVDPTNLAASGRMLSTMVHGSARSDSWLVMQEALAVLHGPDRNTLYETLFFGRQIRFQYAPTSLLPLELLSVVWTPTFYGLNKINTLVFALNAAAMGGLAWLLFRRAPGDRAAPGAAAALDPRGMAALAVVCTLLFYPVVRAHLLGQIQLWIDLLFTTALIAWLLDRRLLAGMLIGCACAIKPQMGLLLLWGLLWNERRFVAGMLAAALPIGLASLALYGLHNHFAYLDVLSFLAKRGESFFANSSVNGILNWYLSPDDSLRFSKGAFAPFVPQVYAGTLIASLLALAGIVLPALLRRGRKAGLTDIGAAAICTVVGSPVAWEHHYGILLPLFLVALWRLCGAVGGRGGLAGIMILLAGWTLVANFIPFANLLAETPWAVLQAYCFFGALLLLGLLIGLPRPSGDGKSVGATEGRMP